MYVKKKNKKITIEIKFIRTNKNNQNGLFDSIAMVIIKIIITIQPRREVRACFEDKRVPDVIILLFM